MIRIYEKSDLQFNNLAAAWSKITHHDKDLFEVSAIILASDHQEEEAEKVAAALKGSTASRTEKFTSVMPCIMVCLLSKVNLFFYHNTHKKDIIEIQREKWGI